jgi:predicted nucleic acid-binding protein
MVKALFDTNILIDYLNAVPEAAAEFDRYTAKAISVVTWIEVMAGAPPALEPPTRAFLDSFELIDIDRNVAEKAVLLRRQHKLKLPDAVIWASAQNAAMLLVTRDGKAFPAKDPGIRMPYQLKSGN